MKTWGSMTKIYSYSKVSELAHIISGFDEENMRFVVPSRNDKVLFPVQSDNILWTWQDIYEDVCASSRKRVLSPPDHLLILKAILNNVIAEFPDKTPSFPGISRSGFLSIISDDIRELLNEAVNWNWFPEGKSLFLIPLPEPVSHQWYFNCIPSSCLHMLLRAR